MLPEVMMYRLIRAFSALLGARLDVVDVAPQVDQRRLEDSMECATQIAEKLIASPYETHKEHGREMMRILTAK